ncbi:26766_t:CDS:2, partial [Racocetra persica]
LNNTLYTIDFQHLPHFRVSNIFMPILQKSVGEKTQFILTKTHKLQLLEENKVDNKVESQPAIVNLFMTKHRGWPSKRFKSALEQTANSQKNIHNPNSTNVNNSQRNQNKYANCENYGHNVRTCNLAS